MLAQRARQKERSQMVASCLAMGETAWSCRCLAPQTCSVLDLVRTERRTLRLAIACGDRSDRTLHPSQVAAFDHPAFRRKDQMSRGIIKRRCSSRRALGSHLAHPEEGPTASLKGLLERIFGQCVSPSPPEKRALSSPSTSNGKRKACEFERSFACHIEGRTVAGTSSAGCKGRLSTLRSRQSMSWNCWCLSSRASSRSR